MSVLSDEITNDPTGKGYAAFLPDQPGHVVELLNAPTETMVKSRLITARGILSGYPGGPMVAAVVLDKLKAATSTISALGWAFDFLKTPEGLDLGDPATQGMLDTLATAEVITTEESANLKALAIQPASRAEVLGLPYVDEEMLRNR
jgi:hypothetical protein